MSARYDGVVAVGWGNGGERASVGVASGARAVFVPCDSVSEPESLESEPESVSLELGSGFRSVSLLLLFLCDGASARGRESLRSSWSSGGTAVERADAVLLCVCGRFDVITVESIVLLERRRFRGEVFLSSCRDLSSFSPWGTGRNSSNHLLVLGCAVKSQSHP